MLDKRAGKTTLLWISGYHWIAGSEEADMVLPDQSPSPQLMGPPPCQCGTKGFYSETFSWPADCRAASTRPDAVLLARLQAGHTPYSRLTPISLTRQSTLNALVEERSRKP